MMMAFSKLGPLRGRAITSAIVDDIVEQEPQNRHRLDELMASVRMVAPPKRNGKKLILVGQSMGKTTV